MYIRQKQEEWYLIPPSNPELISDRCIQLGLTTAKITSNANSTSDSISARPRIIIV